MFAIDVLVANGNCSSCAIETFWAEMRTVLSTFRFSAVPLVLPTDAKERIGSIQSDAVGPGELHAQDIAGADVHKIASEHRFFPQRRSMNTTLEVVTKPGEALREQSTA